MIPTVNLKITGLGNITARLDKAVAAISSRDFITDLLLRTALGAVLLLKVRVLEKGVDVDGRDFTPYTQKYSDWKRKKAGVHFNSRVNLNDSGKMLAAINTKVMSPESILVYVGGAPAVYGLAHQEGNSKLPRRKWFGETKEDKNLLRKMFFDGLEKEIARLG